MIRRLIAAAALAVLVGCGADINVATAPTSTAPSITEAKVNEVARRTAEHMGIPYVDTPEVRAAAREVGDLTCEGLRSTAEALESGAPRSAMEAVANETLAEHAIPDGWELSLKVGEVWCPSLVTRIEAAS